MRLAGGGVGQEDWERKWWIKSKKGAIDMLRKPARELWVGDLKTTSQVRFTSSSAFESKGKACFSVLILYDVFLFFSQFWFSTEEFELRSSMFDVFEVISKAVKYTGIWKNPLLTRLSGDVSSIDFWRSYHVWNNITLSRFNWLESKAMIPNILYFLSNRSKKPLIS